VVSWNVPSRTGQATHTVCVCVTLITFLYYFTCIGCTDTRDILTYILILPYVTLLTFLNYFSCIGCTGTLDTDSHDRLTLLYLHS